MKPATAATNSASMPMNRWWPPQSPLLPPMRRMRSLAGAEFSASNKGSTNGADGASSEWKTISVWRLIRAARERSDSPGEKIMTPIGSSGGKSTAKLSAAIVDALPPTIQVGTLSRARM